MSLDSFKEEILIEKDATPMADKSSLFRDGVLTFVGDQTQRINKVDKVLEALQEQVLTMMEDHEFDLGEVLMAYKTISSESTKRIEALFGLFKPQNGQASHPLLTPPKEQEKSSIDSLNGEELRAVTKLYQLLSKDSLSNEEEDI